MTDDWADEITNPSVVAAGDEHTETVPDIAETVDDMFTPPPEPQAIPLAEIVKRFEGAGDVVEAFALFGDLIPPADKMDRHLLRIELQKVFKTKKLPITKEVILDWFKEAGEASETSALAALIREPEELPEDEEVDGAILIGDLVRTFDSFMDATPEQHLTVALWTLHTYVFDLFDISPFLVFGAPDKECGKTTYLGLVLETAYRALPTSSITGPGIFRVIEEHAPTLVIDEGDSLIKNNLDLAALLNAGHQKRFAITIRMVGDNHKATSFSTWAPKAFTAIGELPDQIASRAIRVELARMSTRTKKVDARMRTVRDSAEGLAARCAKWAKDNAFRIRSTDDIGSGLTGRTADNWEPLLVVAKICGDATYTKALAGAIALSSSATRTVSQGELLLAHLRELFEVHEMPDAMSTEDISNGLVGRDDGPWAHYWSGKVAAGDFRSVGSSLAWKLKPYGIKSRKFRDGNETHRGYLRSDLQPLWDAYLQRGERETPGNDGTNGTVGTPQVRASLPSGYDGTRSVFDGTGLEDGTESQASDQACSVVPSVPSETAISSQCPECSFTTPGLHAAMCPNNSREV